MKKNKEEKELNEWERTLENIIDLYMLTSKMIKAFKSGHLKEYESWWRENVIRNMARNIRCGYTNPKKEKPISKVCNGEGFLLSGGKL